MHDRPVETGASPRGAVERSGLRAIPGGGASNSRPTATTVARGAAGFDTIRLRFRGQEGAYDRARGAGAAVHARGELRRTAGGVTVGTYPDGLVTVEGRLAAVNYGEDDHRLLGADELARAPDAAAALFGLDLAVAPVAVGRADLASELVFPDGREGLELLRAASYVDVPWLKAGTEGSKRDRLETVYWRTVNGRSVVLRLYDKGVESGQAGPGEWLRLERQRRWRRDREPAVDSVATGSLLEHFVGRELGRLVSGFDDVTVCDRDGAVSALRELRASGRLTGEMLCKLAGYVVTGGPGLTLRTEQRWAMILRRLGIALNPNEGGASVVPVAGYVRQFAAAWAA